MRLYINDIEIDLPANFKIARTKQVNDIGSLDDRQTNYTQKIKIPKTKRNVTTFNQLGYTGSTSNIPYQKNTVKLYNSNGECEIFDGYAKVFRTYKDYYDVAIYDGYISFTKAIENKTIAQVGLPDLNHLKNLDTVTDTWSDETTKYRYNVADYNGKMLYDETKLNIDFLIPAALVSYIWDRIFEYFGFTYTGNAFDTQDFQNLWLTYPKEIGAETQVTTLVSDFNWSGQIVYSSTTGITSFDQTFTACDGCAEVLNAYIQGVSFPITGGFLRNSIFNVLQTGLYKITISGTIGRVGFQGVDDVITLWYNDVGGAVLLGEPIDIANYTYGSEFSTVYYINLVAGSTFTIRCNSFIGGTFFSNVTANGDVDTTIEIVEGNTVDFEEALIDFECKDFINEILWRLSLTPFKDKYTNNIKFLTHSEWLQNNTAIDLSDRVGEKLNEKYILGRYAQKNLMKYKYNDSADDYNDGFLRIVNYNLKDSTTIIKSNIYSPELQKTTLVSGLLNVYKFWDKQVKDDGIIKYKSLSNRFYFQRSNFVNFTFTVGSELFGLDQTVSRYAKESFDALSFNEIIERYYQDIYLILNDSKIINYELFLDDAFVSNLDLSNLFYIKQEAANFILNKVPNYISTGVYNCELIQLNIGSDFVETSDNAQILIYAIGPESALGEKQIETNYIFIEYQPISGTIYMKQLTQDPTLGIVYSGFEITDAIDVNASQFVETLNDPLLTQEGWYEIQIIDIAGIESNKTYLSVFEDFVVSPTNSIEVVLQNFGEQIYVAHDRNVFYKFNNFTPTTAILKVRAWNVLTNTAYGNEIITTLTTLTQDILHSINVNFPPGSIFYLITIETNVINYQSTILTY